MDLKKISYKLSILFLPFIIIIEGLFLIDPILEKESQTDYIASIIDKQELIKNTKSTKIVIIGGSGSSYGICSDSIEKETAIRTINESIIFTFGPRFMINQIESYLKKGDIVVISPEYMMINYGDFHDQIKAARFLPSIKKHIEFENILSQISSELRFRINYFKFFLGSFRNNNTIAPNANDTTSVFFRKAFDQNGNLVSHLNNPKTFVQKMPFQRADRYIEVLEYLNFVDAKFKKKGIKLLYSHPAFCKNMTNEDNNNILKVEDFLKNKATFKILDSANSNIFDESYFYDQVYHLNSKGRAIRSKTLAKNIKIALN